MITLLVFSFFAGFITILAPCIWPLLPIVFSASSGGGKRRSLGLTLGVMISFTLFTLFISYLVKIFPLSPNGLRLAATIIIALLGLSMLVPSLGAAFEFFIQQALSPFQSKLKKEGSGFGAGLVTGFSLGLVWAPCAGPILATVAALSATESVNLKVVAVTAAYVLGLGIPLYFFSFFSARLFAGMRAVNKYTGLIQQGFGLVMIITAVLIYTNYAQVLQAKVLNFFPGYSRFLGRVENDNRLQKELDKLAGRKDQNTSEETQLLVDKGPAPNLSAGVFFNINAPSPLTLDFFRGRVVLVDFWTYSCINCVRTLPHLTAWYKRYQKDGLVMIGVHTPEFAFEKEAQNVSAAINQFGITYPVVLDNDYRIWKSFQNHYWPAEFLIDAKGHIRRVHFGEGGYDQMEKAIRLLLAENGHAVEGHLSSVDDQTPRFSRTPETYLGARRMERFASPEDVVPGQRLYSVVPEIPLNNFAYQGSWDVEDESAKAGSDAFLWLKFRAGKVFLVIGPAHGGDRVKVWMDGKALNDIVLDNQRLYTVVDLKGAVETHTLRLGLPPGTSVYAFTFG